METVASFRELFAYNLWANRHVLESLASAPTRSTRAVRAFAHLLLAEEMWLLRLRVTVDNTGFDFWQFQTIEQCRVLFERTESSYAELMRDLTEELLDSYATYKNTRGVEYTTQCRDLLRHVLFHSTYHRGQIAMALRADGGTPVNTDYIGFVRDRDAK
jgi:uncharacterized damage-inducible protein DinB